MNKTGKNIAYLIFGFLTAAAFLSGCKDGNPPGDLDNLSGRHTLSISLLPNSQTEAGKEELRGAYGIDDDVIARESKIYSLAVLVFKNGSDDLDGTKFINRVIDANGFKELDEIKDIDLTAGMRDVFIIANAPDNHFSNVSDRNQFKAKLEELSHQGMVGTSGSGSGEDPIGGVDPDDRITNLVMSQSFYNLPLNSGAEKHYLGYTGNGGRPTGVSTGQPILDGVSPIEVLLVRLVARVAIQKIKFELPASMNFNGHLTSEFNQFVDTVFLVNAKTHSSYFPEETGFANPSGTFGQGNTTGYEYLDGQLSTIANGSTYADYLYKPIANVTHYDITDNHAPLWFYAFENRDSSTNPTILVIGVVFQYLDATNNQKALKAYYPVVINANGGGTAGNHHYHIKRNFQYGINVTIKGLSIYNTNYPGVRSAISPMDMSAIMEIKETVGTHLFPWTGNVYK